MEVRQIERQLRLTKLIWRHFRIALPTIIILAVCPFVIRLVDSMKQTFWPHTYGKTPDDFNDALGNFLTPASYVKSFRLSTTYRPSVSTLIHSLASFVPIPSPAFLATHPPPTHPRSLVYAIAFGSTYDSTSAKFNTMAKNVVEEAGSLDMLLLKVAHLGRFEKSDKTRACFLLLRRLGLLLWDQCVGGKTSVLIETEHVKTIAAVQTYVLEIAEERGEHRARSGRRVTSTTGEIKAQDSSPADTRDREMSPDEDEGSGSGEAAVDEFLVQGILDVLYKLHVSSSARLTLSKQVGGCDFNMLCEAAFPLRVVRSTTAHVQRARFHHAGLFF